SGAGPVHGPKASTTTSRGSWSSFSKAANTSSELSSPDRREATIACACVISVSGGRAFGTGGTLARHPRMSDRSEKAIGPSALDPAHCEALVVAHIADRGTIRALHALLVRAAETRETYAERSAWLEDLGNWLHAGAGGAFARSSDEDRTSRFRGFLLALA